MAGTARKFVNTSLAGARFAAVDLGASLFDDGNPSCASFSNVALAGATFRNASSSDVAIDDATLEGMRINGVLVSEMVANYRRSVYTER
jgi:uncharacterized protein YjbI with pentapeptide repeats